MSKLRVDDGFADVTRRRRGVEIFTHKGTEAQGSRPSGEAGAIIDLCHIGKLPAAQISSSVPLCLCERTDNLRVLASQRGHYMEDSR